MKPSRARAEEFLAECGCIDREREYASDADNLAAIIDEAVCEALEEAALMAASWPADFLDDSIRDLKPKRPS